MLMLLVSAIGGIAFIAFFSTLIDRHSYQIDTKIILWSGAILLLCAGIDVMLGQGEYWCVGHSDYCVKQMADKEDAERKQEELDEAECHKSKLFSHADGVDLYITNDGNSCHGYPIYFSKSGSSQEHSCGKNCERTVETPAQ